MQTNSISRLPEEVTRAVMADMEARRLAKPGEPQNVVQMAEKEQPKVREPLPAWDFRIAGAWMTFVTYPTRFVLGRVLLDWFAHVGTRPAIWYISARNFVTALLGDRVSDAVYRQRMKACGECRDAYVRIVRVGKKCGLGPSFCGLCGCPESRWSRLDEKNKFAAWHCPRRKHPGPYPEDAYRHLIPKEQLEQSAKGCKDCGGK